MGQNKTANHIEQNQDTCHVIIGISGSSRSGKSTLSLSLFHHLCQSLKSSHDTIIVKLFHQDAYFIPCKPIHEETGYENWECPESVALDRLYSDIQQFIAEPTSKKEKSREEKGFSREQSYVDTTCSLDQQEQLHGYLNHLISLQELNHEKNRSKVLVIPPALPPTINVNGGDGDCTNVNEVIERNYGAQSRIGRCIRKIIIVEGFLLCTHERIVNTFHTMTHLHVDKETCKNRRMNTMPVPEDYFEKVLWPSYLKYNKDLVRKSSHLYNHTRMAPIQHLDGRNPCEQVLKETLDYVNPFIFRFLGIDVGEIQL